MIRRLFLYLSLLLSLSSVSCQAQPELLTLHTNNVNVAEDYFLSMHGQSNLVGQSDVSSLPVGLQREFQNVYIWTNPTEADNAGSYQKLQAGVNNNLPALLGKYGAEIAFADRFENEHPDDFLYISKFGVGGTTVFNTACPNNWSTSCSGSLAERAMLRWDLDARAAIPDGTIEHDLGMIWYQGETDASNPTWSAAFLTNTAATLAYYRTQIGISTWPILVVQINYGAVANADGPPVRIAQSKKSGNLNDQATYAYNTQFKTDNYIPKPGDEIHITDQLGFGYDLYLHYFPASSTSPWTVEYQQVLQRAITLNYTLPSPTVQAAWNTFVLARIADGSWERLDILYNFSYNTTTLSDFSLLNMISPGAFQITTAGTIAYGPKGWKGNGSTGYLNTNFIPGFNGVNYTQNDASRGLWMATVHSIDAFLDGAVTLNLNTIRASSTTGQRINQTGNLNTAIALSGTGYTAIDRVDATNINFFKVAVKTGRTATSTGLTTVNQFILRSGSNFGDTEVGLYYMGRSLTDTQHNNIAADYQTYLTAIGL